jgi:phosphopantetheine adenylyltransferase
MKILISILVILVMCLIFVGHNSSTGVTADKIIAEEKNRIEAKYQADMKNLQDRISTKEKELAESKVQVADYRTRLQVTEAKLRAITKPATAAEAKEKLKGMGYEVR